MCRLFIYFIVHSLLPTQEVVKLAFMSPSNVGYTLICTTSGCACTSFVTQSGFYLGCNFFWGGEDVYGVNMKSRGSWGMSPRKIWSLGLSEINSDAI